MNKRNVKAQQIGFLMPRPQAQSTMAPYTQQPSYGPQMGLGPTTQGGNPFSAYGAPPSPPPVQSPPPTSGGGLGGGLSSLFGGANSGGATSGGIQGMLQGLMSGSSSLDLASIITNAQKVIGVVNQMGTVVQNLGPMLHVLQSLNTDAEGGGDSDTLTEVTDDTPSTSSSGSTKKKKKKRKKRRLRPTKRRMPRRRTKKNKKHWVLDH